MKKLFSILTVFALIMSFSLSTFAADTVDPALQMENNITADMNTDTSAATSEAKDDTILKSDVKSFRGKFTAMFVELNKFRAECKSLWEQIKAENQAIKTAWTNFKASLKEMDKEQKKKALADTKAKIEPIRTQIKALHNDILTLRAQKKTEWTNFRAAVKAKDEAKARTALTNIIEYKKQIIEKQKAIIPLKQAILEVL